MCAWTARAELQIRRGDNPGTKESSFATAVAVARATGLAVPAGPAFQAQVWSARERKTIRKTFRELAEARAWRHESQTALRNGLPRSTSPTTLKEAAEAWLGAAEASIVTTRSGEAYKPSAIRAYRQALNHRTLPLLGSRRLTAISHTMHAGSVRPRQGIVAKPFAR